MSFITVVDVNEEAKQEVEPIQNEEATEQIEPSSSIGEPTNEIVENTSVEEPKEEPKEEQKAEPKQEAKPKPKPKPKPSDRVDCKTCGKNLSYKNYRYRHEKNMYC